MKPFRTTGLFLLLLTAAGGGAAATVAVTLASAGRPAFPVVVAPGASARVRAIAGELATCLGRIAGTTFPVRESADGASGIVVGRAADYPALKTGVAFAPADPFRREEYLLRTHARGAWLLGASELAVEHAAWDFLYRLGYRQFFPGETWEVAPRLARPRLAVDAVEKPAFLARRIAWHSPQRWWTRNRVANGFELQSSHSNPIGLAADQVRPEFCALVGGKREYRGANEKWCLSNPALAAEQRVADYVARHWAGKAEAFWGWPARGNPDAYDSISMEPSDGAGWCECDACAKLGTPSDRAARMANLAAAALDRQGFADKYVGIYAYAGHAAPPAVRLHPRVIVTLTGGFLGALEMGSLVRGWRAAGAARLGVYPYLSVEPWDQGLMLRNLRSSPGGIATCPSYMAESIPRFYGWGMRFYDGESQQDWGANGLSYYLGARMLWDLREADRLPALIDDFLAKAFGAGREPMREYYRLIDRERDVHLSGDLVGRLYRCLDAARAAAAGDAPAQARLRDLALYTRYVELCYLIRAHREVGQSPGWGQAPPDPALDEALALHRRRMRTSVMLAAAAGTEAPYTPAEIDAFIDAGRDAYAIRPRPTRTYTQDLVPARLLGLPAAPAGGFVAGSQALIAGRLDLFTWTERAGETVVLRLVNGASPYRRISGNARVTLSALQPGAETTVAEDRTAPPDGQEHPLALRAPRPGLHRIALRLGHEEGRVAWDDGRPMTVYAGPARGLAPDYLPVSSWGAGNCEPWTLYFYVPRGARTVDLWLGEMCGGDDWPVTPAGRVLDGHGKVAFAIPYGKPGFFSIPVPAGEDGALWKFDRCTGRAVTLLNVPPYLARSERELLLPREVVRADRRR